MRHNTTPTGIFLCRQRSFFARKLAALLRRTIFTIFTTFTTFTVFTVCAVFALVSQLFVSCDNGFFHDALYTKTLTISTNGKTGTLLWIDDGGDVRRKTFTEEEAETAAAVITVSKGYVTPILFFENEKEAPEGFIYPFEAEFTEAGGFAAHILYRLIKDANDTSSGKNAVRPYCAHFNWKKFQELVEQAAEKGENPWGCDQTLILESIANGTFTPHVLKP